MMVEPTQQDGMLRRLSGTMPYYSKRFDDRPVIAFIDSTLRGMGQICLMNNPISGLLIIIALATNSLWMAAAFIIGGLSATLAAHGFGYDRGVIRAGLYSFNGALMGLLTSAFLTPSWDGAVVFYTVIAAIVTVPVMNATIHFFVVTLNGPALSATFSLVGISALLVAPVVANGRANHALFTPIERTVGEPNTTFRAVADGDPVSVVETLFNAVFRGISEVFLVDSVVTGIILVLAFAVCSRIAAGMAVLGSLVGALTAVAMGADGNTIYLGLWGYNAVVVAICLFGVSLEPRWPAFLYTVVACAASAVLYGAVSQFLGPFGVIPLSLPLVIIIIGSVLALHTSKFIAVVPITEYATAEERNAVRRRVSVLA